MKITFVPFYDEKFFLPISSHAPGSAIKIHSQPLSAYFLLQPAFWNNEIYFNL